MPFVNPWIFGTRYFKQKREFGSERGSDFARFCQRLANDSYRHSGKSRRRRQRREAKGEGCQRVRRRGARLAATLPVIAYAMWLAAKDRAVLPRAGAAGAIVRIGAGLLVGLGVGPLAPAPGPYTAAHALEQLVGDLGAFLLVQRLRLCAILLRHSVFPLFGVFDSLSLLNHALHRSVCLRTFHESPASVGRLFRCRTAIGHSCQDQLLRLAARKTRDRSTPPGKEVILR